MKRVFLILSLFIGLINMGSCQNTTSKLVEIEENSISFLSLNIDSILVMFCNYTRHTKYMDYYISFNYNDKIVIKSGNSIHKYPSISIAIDSLDLINSFVNFINKFYLDKTEKIILERKKTNVKISGEYPLFFITGYKNGKKIVNESTEFSDNELFVFNPLFIEFYELTRLLVGFVDAELELQK